jgi:hypothetical protein
MEYDLDRNYVSAVERSRWNVSLSNIERFARGSGCARVDAAKAAGRLRKESSVFEALRAVLDYLLPNRKRSPAPRTIHEPNHVIFRQEIYHDGSQGL